MAANVIEKGVRDAVRTQAITYRTVDADAHVNPPPTFWSDYLPKHLRELAPQLEHGEDADYVVFEGRRKKLNLLSDQAGRKGQDFKITGRLSDMRGGGWLPDERLKDMDRDGIDAAILFGGGPLGTPEFRAVHRELSRLQPLACGFLCVRSPSSQRCRIHSAARRQRIHPDDARGQGTRLHCGEHPCISAEQ